MLRAFLPRPWSAYNRAVSPYLEAHIPFDLSTGGGAARRSRFHLNAVGDKTTRDKLRMVGRGGTHCGRVLVAVLFDLDKVPKGVVGVAFF